jgi:hypothetical protein
MGSPTSVFAYLNPLGSFDHPARVTLARGSARDALDAGVRAFASVGFRPSPLALVPPAEVVPAGRRRRVASG